MTVVDLAVAWVADSVVVSVAVLAVAWALDSAAVSAAVSVVARAVDSVVESVAVKVAGSAAGLAHRFHRAPTASRWVAVSDSSVAE